ncbi:MAG TPA: hypothetical protein IGR64_03030 [Leptolyngbyaceae cyanobacterium M65_K2018_010]|nr:hypothetical protein [Leptolyngbyaceae cyanobacterium M65_K2018_010]
MNYFKYVSWLAGLATATMVASALPAYAEAESLSTESLTEAGAGGSVSAVTTEAVAEPAELTASEVAPELSEVLVGDSATSANLLVEAQTFPIFELRDETSLAFDQAGIQYALANPGAEQVLDLGDGVQIAQSNPAYGGVAPAYLGFGGNIGFISSDQSAIGDFGAVVISKISLGPRFALRPNFFISQRATNITIPLTYNFNTLEFAGFRFQPYVGLGADIPFSGDVAFMVNGGADVPISRDFTLNSALNFRFNNFGLGLTLGVAYNFPFFFD